MSNNLRIYQTNTPYILSSKAILVGSSYVGKTSLLQKFNTSRFDPQLSKPSIGVNYVPTYLEVDSVTMKLDFWDTAGSERYKTVTPAFYRSSAAIVFVFDVTSKETFQAVERWMTEAFEAVKDDIVKVLVGNKCDQLFEREVSMQEGIEYAKKKGMEYLETSAKTGEGVVQMFEKTAQWIVEKFGGDQKRKGHYLFDKRKEDRIWLKGKRINNLDKNGRSCMC